MAWEERRSWLYLGVSAITYLTYLAIILGRAQDAPITEVPYARPMLACIGLAIVAMIVLSILAAILSPGDAGKTDERDAGIHRYGERIGEFVFSIGGLGALILTMVEAEYFWIGNAIYLSFVLAALIGTTVKLVAYRRGFQPW